MDRLADILDEDPKWEQADSLLNRGLYEQAIKVIRQAKRFTEKACEVVLKSCHIGHVELMKELLKWPEVENTAERGYLKHLVIEANQQQLLPIVSPRSRAFLELIEDDDGTGVHMLLEDMYIARPEVVVLAASKAPNCLQVFVNYKYVDDNNRLRCFEAAMGSKNIDCLYVLLTGKIGHYSKSWIAELAVRTMDTRVITFCLSSPVIRPATDWNVILEKYFGIDSRIDRVLLALRKYPARYSL